MATGDWVGKHHVANLLAVGRKLTINYRKKRAVAPPLKPANLVQPSLIFPVPCEFINARLPHVAVIRPSDDRFAGAKAAIQAITDDGLFFGQSTKFFDTVQQLAEEADAATREG
jgi:hypothetical protein